ncbi:hypothetical protein V5O48_015455 [Marasmius crinis-equi]|uniref:Uncharacterized protein n=1 Tax=Marasmius crinis-equi TaxID=585013 RepID=A0ABR3EUG3_9AGAR
MSEYFREARLENVTLNNPNFSHVRGDQYNHNNAMILTTTRAKKGLRLWRSKEEAEFEQFNEIKRGDIRLIRDISSYVPRYWKKRKAQYMIIECEKKIFTGEIMSGTGQGVRLTVVGYEGRDAQKEWMRDFKEYSRTL